MEIKELIGKRFKRNVYGVSLFTSTIVETAVHWKMIKLNYYIPEIRVRSRSGIWYSLNEIIIIR